MFSPRSLKELAGYAQPLPGLIERAEGYAQRWKAALGSVGEEALQGFVEANAGWRERLAPAATKKLDDNGRRSALDELLPALEAYARDRPDLWTRLHGLHERAHKASEVAWCLEVRRAAVRRMQAILERIAGRVLLDEGAEKGDDSAAAQRVALERLEACEAFEPGLLPVAAKMRPEPELGRLPPVAEEIRLVQPLPETMPKVPAPPEVGDAAAALPDSLTPVAVESLPALSGKPHILFFWATWCGPCKRAVPDLMSFAAANGLEVLAISDEDPKVVTEFLDRLAEPFFENVAADVLRRSFRAYGVGGTPNIIWIDAQGMVRQRQVGYDSTKGLEFDGWRPGSRR